MADSSHSSNKQNSSFSDRSPDSSHFENEAEAVGSRDHSENRYFRLKVCGLARKSEDEFTQLAFEAGAAGVAEDLRFEQQDLRYEPEVIETPVFDVNVYFEKAPSESCILELQARFPECRFEMLAEENKDWLAEWKKGFKAFSFAGPFWIIPRWLEAPAEAPVDPSHLIYVEPGMAFGTGTHETTRLAAALIVEEIGRAKPESLLDVGTGTGILALVAHRLGVGSVVGIDNDSEACRTARENLALNSAPQIQIPDLSLEDISENYDIVVANIIDGVLTILRDDLTRALRPGGRMILSGILLERENDFYLDFTSATGLRLIKKVTEGEWSAAILEKPL